jgi:polysaccharide pyruvyl transferase WcaK-like protein
VTSPRHVRKRLHAPRLGLFGLLGQGNLGNDGSLEAVLAYLSAAHPDAVLDARCSGPEVTATRYGIPADALRWYEPEGQRVPGIAALGMRCLGLSTGLVVDTFRTASWVRRHDGVIVPGMGVLESTVPMRPWQTPYLMFLLCASGKLLGTKVALVSVGTNVIDQRLTRWLVTWAARLAHYRSFRDTFSRDAMQQMGLDVSRDSVYPDVVFSLPAGREEENAPVAVGVGVMDYSGANADRQHADELRSAYIEKMTRFVLWLIDNNRPVRLFTSDSADDPVIAQILGSVRALYPELGSAQVIAEPVTSMDELMRQTASVGTVVATRYHNVLYALKLARPTVAIGYAAKHDALMAEMGMSRYCQPAKSLDVARLIEQFTELESRSAELRVMIRERNAAKARLVDSQFEALSVALFSARESRSGTSPLARVSENTVSETTGVLKGDDDERRSPRQGHRSQGCRERGAVSPARLLEQRKPAVQRTALQDEEGR